MWENDDLALMHEAMFRRRSVRALDPETLPLETLEETLKRCVGTVPLLPLEPVSFRLLQPYQLKGMVAAKAPHYLAVYAAGGNDARMNAAFRLQQMDLWFSAQGYGSCWLGMPRPTPEAAQADGLDFVVLLAFGRSREYPWRDSSFEFSRKSLMEISNASDLDDLLEPVRLAPSGMNRQPWFLSGDRGAVHLYGKRNNALKKKLYGFMPYLDLGIALCHLWLSALGAGAFGGFQRELAGKAPRGYGYTWSVLLNFPAPQREPEAPAEGDAQP